MEKNMNDIYDLEEIKSRADCRQMAQILGIPKANNGRYIATWRGGKNGNVAIEEKEWYDHKEQRGGSVLDLVMAVKGGCPLIMAAKFTAEQYGIQPIKPMFTPGRKSRYDDLIEQGYKEISRDAFTDVDGNALHYEVRMEHPTEKKEFLQCDASGRWSIKHVETVLFNLPKIAPSTYALIVEGVKDAKTLIEWGFTATTNAGGAGNWKDSYSDALAGKICCIIPDNDIAGAKHAQVVGKSLTGKAKEIRVLTLSKIEKGDVTDWRDKEGGTKAQLTEMLKSAPLWEALEDGDTALLNAKEANLHPFSNYRLEKTKKPGKDGQYEKTPRLVGDMIDDLHRRFLGFPRVVGEGALFDHDRDSKSIRYLSDTPDLFAWMQEKSGKQSNWHNSADGFISKDEFFRSVKANAPRYESISRVPDWPRRDDVYYCHAPLPKPTQDHRAFEGLIDMFNPANEYFRALIAAMFTAPLFFRRGIPRPLWIIDSEDGQNTGKTTLAESVAELYGDSPIRANAKTMTFNMERIIKSMLSTTGRDKRVFLLDNVTGNFKSEELADLVTASSITGMAPYGRGEETRPNNLTYIVTCNSGTIDTDLATRAFIIFVKRAELSKAWKTRLMDYIAQQRLQIFADMIDRIQNGNDFNEPSRTRFPEFETTVLQRQCKNLAELKSVYATIEHCRDEANSEEDVATQIQEAIEQNLEGLTSLPRCQKVFIPSKTITQWLKNGIDLPVKQDSDYIQKVRELAKNRTLECVDPKISRFPPREVAGVKMRRGVMYIGPSYDSSSDEVHCVTYDGNKNDLVKVTG